MKQWFADRNAPLNFEGVFITLGGAQAGGFLGNCFDDWRLICAGAALFALLTFFGI